MLVRYGAQNYLYVKVMNNDIRDLRPLVGEFSPCSLVILCKPELRDL